MLDLAPCPKCHEELAYTENESGSWAYVTCPVCGAHTAPWKYTTEEEKKEAERIVTELWNMGKVIGETVGD